MINAICWIIAIAVFLILEGITTAMISIWFAVGALAGLITYYCGGNIAVQMFVFFIVSLAMILCLRKIAVKSIKSNNKNKTNMDRIIGQNIVVTQQVDNGKGCGTAMINDVEWKLKSLNDEVINEGETVKITDVEGVKLIVTRYQ